MKRVLVAAAALLILILSIFTKRFVSERKLAENSLEVLSRGAAEELCRNEICREVFGLSEAEAREVFAGFSEDRFL